MKTLKRGMVVLLLSMQFFSTVPAAAAQRAGFTADGQEETSGSSLKEYQEYKKRFDDIKRESDIAAHGFQTIENHTFPISFQAFGDVSFIPALDQKYHRLAIFLTQEDGRIVYKTDQLETNNRNRGELEQPNRGIAAVAFQDMDKDGLTDIVLITVCDNEIQDQDASAGKKERETIPGVGKTYKIGDVLFQNSDGFYRDWRVSDKINRFSMNKSIGFITSFVRGGYSTEFLYTATTKKELLDQGFTVISEQSYWRQFEKLGRLLVVPGYYTMAHYHVFMIYLVNEQGYIVWSFQPMGDYENLYELKGITCKDIDGDGLKDIVVLARYSYGGETYETVIESDYSIYYQRTGGFYLESPTDSRSGKRTDMKSQYPCKDSDTLEELVKKARAYWGWRVES